MTTQPGTLDVATEEQILAEIAARRERLTMAEAEFARIEHEELPRLHAENGLKLDELTASANARQQVLERTYGPGQKGVLVDSLWRLENPAASAALNQHERLEKAQKAVHLAIQAKDERWSYLKNLALPKLRGELTAAEDLLATHRAQQAAVLDEHRRGVQPGFQTLLQRVKGGWA